MLKSRRGLLAAGLAVAVVGALGVASTLNAGAEQITGAPEQVAAAVPSGPALPPTPPSVLPWGQRPTKVHKGRPGTSARSLRAQGLAAASNDTSGSTNPRGRYAPKGRWGKKSYLKTEKTDIAPPAPPEGTASPDSETEPSPEATETTTSPEQTSPDETGPDETGPDETGPDETTAAATPDETATAGTPEATGEPQATGDTPQSTATSETRTTAPEPSGATPNKKAYYLYNTASQAAEVDGAYASMYIGKPTLDKRDYHSLGEIALQSADEKQIVEIGWTVDRLVNGDDDPHLFVYHWVNKQESCYNGCGYKQYSKNIKPGDTLAPDTTKKFGIQYSDGAWWVAFDSEWIGYFPESLWNDEGVKFNRGGFIQVFGEVAASRAEPCGTTMGNGVDALDKGSKSAYMTGIGYLNGPEVDMYMRSEVPDFYPVFVLNAKAFRYGGKGVRKDGTSACG